MLFETLQWRVFARLALAVFAGAACSALASTAGAQEACFERLDSGVDLTGWQRSTTNHHGPGTGWTFEGGALTGRQTSGQQGGILMTSKIYKDVEVVLEVKIDWGCDSGIFFRTTAGDRAYQVNVDHLMGGGIGTIYGESFNTELRARDYTLTNQGNTAVVEAGHTPIFDLAKWSMLWRPADFNELRARIEGNPPHIQVWLSGTKVMDFTDTQLRSEVNASGPLAIQVHGGSDRWIAGGTVRYRNIRARDLTVACPQPEDAGAADTGPAIDHPDATTETGAGPDAAADAAFGDVPDSGSQEDVASPSDAAPAVDADAGPADTQEAVAEVGSVPDAGPDGAADSGAGSGGSGPPTDASVPTPDAPGAEAGPGPGLTTPRAGCSCSTIPSSPATGAPAFLLLALAAARRRTRKRRPSAGDSRAAHQACEGRCRRPKVNTALRRL